jgi:hypothetical protein
VAGDAVRSEPVSRSFFRITGKNTGKTWRKTPPERSFGQSFYL